MKFLVLVVNGMTFGYTEADLVWRLAAQQVENGQPVTVAPATEYDVQHLRHLEGEPIQGVTAQGDLLDLVPLVRQAEFIADLIGGF